MLTGALSLGVTAGTSSCSQLPSTGGRYPSNALPSELIEGDGYVRDHVASRLLVTTLSTGEVQWRETREQFFHYWLPSLESRFVTIGSSLNGAFTLASMNDTGMREHRSLDRGHGIFPLWEQDAQCLLVFNNYGADGTIESAGLALATESTFDILESTPGTLIPVPATTAVGHVAVYDDSTERYQVHTLGTEPPFRVDPTNLGTYDSQPVLVHEQNVLTVDSIRQEWAIPIAGLLGLDVLPGNEGALIHAQSSHGDRELYRLDFASWEVTVLDTPPVIGTTVSNGVTMVVTTEGSLEV